MKLKSHLLALIFAMAVVAPIQAKMANPDPKVLKADLAKANALYADQDIPGLMTLLDHTHLFAQREIALKLGRLGATEALGDLRELDEGYADFACCPSGEFGVAVLLIENPGKDRQRAMLLDVATESGPQTKHAHSVIDAAGRELARYEGAEIEERLAKVNEYGAQYTVLSQQCRRLGRADAIARCIEVLSRHETPQKAQAAEEILISFGPSVAAPVRKLKAKAEARKGPFDSTVVSRCEDILANISR